LSITFLLENSIAKICGLYSKLDKATHQLLLPNTIVPLPTKLIAALAKVEATMDP
jgi:hypothetical protein